MVPIWHWLLKMATTVPKTVVPLPDTIIGATMDGSGNIIVDEAGNPLVGNRQDQILNAIYALAQEFRKMSGTIEQQIQAGVATLVADNTAQSAALTSIQQLIANMQPGTMVTQATLDAFNAAVAGATANVTMADAIVATGTATATEAPPAS